MIFIFLKAYDSKYEKRDRRWGSEEEVLQWLLHRQVVFPVGVMPAMARPIAESKPVTTLNPSKSRRFFIYLIGLIIEFGHGMCVYYIDTEKKS